MHRKGGIFALLFDTELYSKSGWAFRIAFGFGLKIWKMTGLIRAWYTFSPCIFVFQMLQKRNWNNFTTEWRLRLSINTMILLDRQPRRFIYPKDGGRFDAPKMHVFTHLLRKCFTGKSKVRLRPPKSTIYGGSKWPLFIPKTAWIKIA